MAFHIAASPEIPNAMENVFGGIRRHHASMTPLWPSNAAVRAPDTGTTGYGGPAIERIERVALGLPEAERLDYRLVAPKRPVAALDDSA